MRIGKRERNRWKEREEEKLRNMEAFLLVFSMHFFKALENFFVLFLLLIICWLYYILLASLLDIMYWLKCQGD